MRFLMSSAIVLIAVTSAGATFTVNSTVDAVDANPGDGVCATAAAACTLRAAVQEGNALAGADTITLPAGTYLFTISGTQEDAAARGDLDITSDLTINGAGAATTIIDGANLDRVIDIPSGSVDVTISALTIRNGNASIGEASPRQAGAIGGGILSMGAANLTISDAVVSGNRSRDVDGGISHIPRDAAGNATGVITLIRSRVENNVGGGGCAGMGIRSAGANRIVESTISGNTTLGGGGGICNIGNLTVEDTTISGNSAQAGAGAAISHGFVPGAIPNAATLRRVRIEANTGGGIRNSEDMTVEDSIIDRNSGGGILNGGNMTLRQVTISRNTARPDPHVVTVGGGIINSLPDFPLPPTTTTLENVTVSNNQSGTEGGGIWQFGRRGRMDLNNVTIAENRTEAERGGGISVIGEGLVVLRNSIVARNNDLAGNAPDCFAETGMGAENSLIQNPSNCMFTSLTPTNITGVDPLLGPLANNGGNSETHALLTGSPAIDRGSGCAATDQRGVARPLDGNGDGIAVCDIGAFEAPPVVLSNPVPIITTLNPSSVTAGSADITLVVSGTNFVSGAEVRWNGTARPTTFVSATEVRATIPATDLTSPGTATVTVFNPAPGGGSSNALTFTIAAAVAIPLFSPLGLLLLGIALATLGWFSLSKMS